MPESKPWSIVLLKVPSESEFTSSGSFLPKEGKEGIFYLIADLVLVEKKIQLWDSILGGKKLKTAEASFFHVTLVLWWQCYTLVFVTSTGKKV